MIKDTTKLFDLVIIGAGVSGCAAAIFCARLGYSVAILEKSKSNNHYKKICTHSLQKGAIEPLTRLGVIPQLEALGAVKTEHQFQTKWGLIKHDNVYRSSYCGLNMTREKLDPFIRREATSYKNVQLFSDVQIDYIHQYNSEINHIEFRDKIEKHQIKAKIYIIADGAASPSAELLNIKPTKILSPMAGIYAYFNCSAKKETTIWLKQDLIAFSIPCNNDLLLLSLGFTREKYQNAFLNKKDTFYQCVKTLQGNGSINEQNRISPFIGIKQFYNCHRETDINNLVLLGDAHYSVDPTTGLGLTWGLQQAMWLGDILEASSDNNYEVVATNHKKTVHQKLHANFNYFAKKSYNFEHEHENALLQKAVNSPKLAKLFLDFHSGLLTYREYKKHLFAYQANNSD